MVGLLDDEPRGKAVINGLKTGTSRGSVDGDPHFIVRPPGGNETLCFNVQQRPGVFLNLVEDPETGITVNGELVGKNKDGGTDPAGNTYIGRLGLQSERLGVKVEVTTESITITSGAHESVRTWNKTGTQTQSGLTLSVLDGGRVTVTMEEAGTFVIVLHRPLKKSSKHRDYLGLYTEDSHWLSNRTRGILGQFYSGNRLEISAASSASGSQGTEATLSVRGNRIKVSGQWRRDFHTDAQRGEQVFCWFVRDGGKVLMDGKEEDFLVSGLYEHLC
ncbi:inter-alpha-trypsin inhibitor heavy chain H3-like [Ascaphus truei]|uniref:inter-alpha-trypsin inhibitor heavy chain H3-like n=1 Tax=Ascaphus truei TaxID=8439 RepID=UPI003F5A608E